MKEIIAQIINQLNRITHSNITSRTNLQANLTSLSNLLNIRYVSYWTFNQSKYLTSKFRLFTLGLLFLMVSILNGISGEFFLFLLVFEFVYSNTVKLFNFIVINSLNDFIISYTNETLLLKIILKNVNEFEAYLITLINDFKSLLINQKTNTGLKKKYVKKSFNNYILLNKKLGKLIEVTGQINAYHIQSSKKIISLELKAKRVINQYIKRAKKQYFNIEKNMNKFTKRKVKNMNQVFFATTIILGNTANTIIFTLKTIMGKLKDKCNLKLKEVNSRVTSNDFSNNIKVEWAWIVVPSLMIVDVVTNSSDLIYFEDKPNVKTNITLLGWAKANQWYWSYQYANISKFVAEELMQKTYDSYLVVADLLEMGTPRLLLSINEFIQPSIFNLKLLLTSVDVIHSFALAQIGSKIDALPGRINQIFLNFAQLGLFLGQCSELCGFSHGFMPITKSILIVKGYFNFLVMGFSGQTLVKNMLCDLYEIKTQTQSTFKQHDKFVNAVYGEKVVPLNTAPKLTAEELAAQEAAARKDRSERRAFWNWISGKVCGWAVIITCALSFVGSAEADRYRRCDVADQADALQLEGQARENFLIANNFYDYEVPTYAWVSSLVSILSAIIIPNGLALYFKPEDEKQTEFPVTGLDSNNSSNNKK